jgi:hypothetical protein
MLRAAGAGPGPPAAVSAGLCSLSFGAIPESEQRLGVERRNLWFT